MTIRTKLLLSFLSIILLTTALGLVSYWTVNSMSAGLIPLIEKNDRITALMLKMRGNEKDFLSVSLKDPIYYNQGFSKYLQSFESNYEKINEELASIREISDDPNYLQSIERVEKGLTSYKDNFLKVAEAKKERGFKDWGKIGELRDAVHAVEDRLNSVGTQKDLSINMLMNRRHEKDYLLRNDPKYQLKLSKRVAEFHELLEVSSLSAEDKENLASLMNNYKDKFDAVVLIDEQIGRNPNSGLTSKYLNSILELEPVIAQETKLFDEEVGSTVNRNLALILLALGLAVLLGLFLVFYLSSKISKPLHQIAEAGKKVAAGELHTKLPQVTTNDEVKEIHSTMNSLIAALRYHVNR